MYTKGGTWPNASREDVPDDLHAVSALAIVPTLAPAPIPVLGVGNTTTTISSGCIVRRSIANVGHKRGTGRAGVDTLDKV